MNDNDAEDLDSSSRRLRDESRSHMKNGLEYIKIIFGPKRIKYQEHKITYYQILN